MRAQVQSLLLLILGIVHTTALAVLALTQLATAAAIPLVTHTLTTHNAGEHLGPER